MNLPELPKQHKKQEADFSIILKHWIEKHPILTSSLEVKDTRGKDSLSFKEIKDEQIAYANRINSPKGAWIRTLGQNGEPDYIWMCNEPAYIVIRYPRFFCFIPIGNLLFEKQKSKRKSLTSDRAKAIATQVVNL